MQIAAGRTVGVLAKVGIAAAAAAVLACLGLRLWLADLAPGEQLRQFLPYWIGLGALGVSGVLLAHVSLKAGDRPSAPKASAAPAAPAARPGSYDWSSIHPLLAPAPRGAVQQRAD